MSSASMALLTSHPDSRLKGPLRPEMTILPWSLSSSSSPDSAGAASTAGEGDGISGALRAESEPLLSPRSQFEAFDATNVPDSFASEEELDSVDSLKIQKFEFE